MVRRVAAVRGVTQGSGLLLRPRLVLTADHVVRGEDAEAAVPGGAGWVRCQVIWRSPDLDAALLLADRDLVAGAVPPVRWARPDRTEPVAGCHVTGFPAVERGGAGELESTQVLGSLLPQAGLLKGSQVFVAQQAAPAGEDSPWAGLSGAGVIFRDVLLGLVLRDHKRKSWNGSQLEVLPASALLDAPGFAFHVTEQLGSALKVHDGELADAEFEEEYAKSIQADYGRIRIFGLNRAHGQGRRGWGLDTAYLTLQATDLPGGSRSAGRRVPELLRERSRVLIRGLAGPGKTTLVQWLATWAAAASLGEELAGLGRRVPLVLQLRKLARQGNFSPQPDELLALDGRLNADGQPPGWAHRVLSAGRAMLLVDGLDEVPDAGREEILQWLERFLERYPHTWTLATVRPSAVPPGWLAHLDFDELMLSPMTAVDRTRFIDRWHRAVLAELVEQSRSPAETVRWQQEIDGLRAGLLRVLERSEGLAQITDSPLVCAMVCALNRESDGALPAHRMEIYRDALSMLLVRRDDAKQLGPVEQLTLSEPEQLALLRRVAHWLVRNNQVEGERDTAIRQISGALGSLPAVARQGDAEQVYTHLLNRSGLLAETSTETFQFIHRTFQDYLAALEFREQGDFGLLAGMAKEEHWRDAIRMTVGHCGPRERADLLRRLVAAGDRAANPDALTVHQLAGSCLPYAAELDKDVRELVLGRLLEHLTESPSLVPWYPWYQIGEDLVVVLDRLAQRRVRIEITAVGSALGEIGGAEALRVLGDLVALGGRGSLGSWRRFDRVGYVDQVLSRADFTRQALWVDEPEQIELLVERELPVRAMLLFREALAAAPPGLRLPTVERLVLLEEGTGGNDQVGERFPALKELRFASPGVDVDIPWLTGTAASED
ncbi:NACHT domain-containing protein [Kitasatospora sp. NPDC096147]|uniref:NACHT domain-containing protein n=1 Tax=Kitasatospora sp. NPDC096147 TaxID=3364093 RepID=UPI0038244290